jgi:hypothetical protein
MSDQLTFEEIWTLRAETEESRWLAASFVNRLTVMDLESYAAELEAEAARMQLKQELSCRHDPAPRNHAQNENLRTIIWAGRA